MCKSYTGSRELWFHGLLFSSVVPLIPSICISVCICGCLRVCGDGTQRLCTLGKCFTTEPPPLLPKPPDSWLVLFLTQLLLCSVGWATCQMLLEEAVRVRSLWYFAYPSQSLWDLSLKDRVPCTASGQGLQPDYPALPEVAQVLSTQGRLA